MSNFALNMCIDDIRNVRNMIFKVKKFINNLWNSTKNLRVDGLCSKLGCFKT